MSESSREKVRRLANEMRDARERLSEAEDALRKAEEEVQRRDPFGLWRLMDHLCHRASDLHRDVREAE